MLQKIFRSLPKAGKTYWREILAVLLLLIGIYFFRAQRRELLSINEKIRNADTAWLFVGIIVTILYILLQAAMYVSSFAAVQGKLGWVRGSELFLKRNFLSVFLPAGGISSLAYTPAPLRKGAITKMQTHQASGIYAFVGLLTVFLVGLPLLAIAFIQSKNVAHSFDGLLVITAVLVAFFIAAYSLQKKGKLYRFVGRRWPKLVPAIDTFFSFRFTSKPVLLTITISLLIECCGIAHLFIAAKALGLHPTLLSCGLAYVVSVLLMIVSPFLRGLGAVELSMAFTLTSFGFTPAHALAVTVLYRLFEFWLPLLAGFFSFAWKGRFIFMRLFPSFLVFALGVVNILSVITPPIASRMKVLKSFIPMASINASNELVLLVGFVLLITSAFLLKGQRNAWLLAMVLSVVSLLGHIFKALDYEEALLAGSVIIILAASSRQYRLNSNKRLIQLGLLSVALVFFAVLVFGFIGFYFLQKRHFGIDFTWQQSLQLSAKNFLLIYTNDLVPKTKFATEFSHLMQLLGFIAWGFLAFVLIKPIFRRKVANTSPLQRANDLLHLYGDSAVDYFKICKDKLLYFSDRCDAFVAYRIANGFAVVLEEPVCAEHNKVAVLHEFEEHCRKMSLKTAFYRVDEGSMPYFDYLKKRRLLIGQEAVLDVTSFSLEGRDKKSLRNGLNSLAKKGFHTAVIKAPLAGDVVQQLKAVSNEWLEHYDKKETIFSQGMFAEKEIAQNDVIVIRDSNETIVAFLNIVPDFAPEECTYDLIRKTAEAPAGCMDALIIELVAYAKALGLRFINLGLVPLSGIEQPNNTAEQIMQYSYKKLKRFRHYSGLRAFKEKYATVWVNKYLVYENDFDLLQLPIALNKVMQP